MKDRDEILDEYMEHLEHYYLEGLMIGRLEDTSQNRANFYVGIYTTLKPGQLGVDDTMVLALRQRIAEQQSIYRGLVQVEKLLPSVPQIKHGL